MLGGGGGGGVDRWTMCLTIGVNTGSGSGSGSGSRIGSNTWCESANVNQLSSLMPRASCKVSTQYRLRHVLRNRSMVFGLLPVDVSSLPFDVMSMLNKSCRAQVSNESKGLHAADAIVTWAAGDCSDMVHRYGSCHGMRDIVQGNL